MKKRTMIFIISHYFNTIILLNHFNFVDNYSNFAKNQNSKTNRVEIEENL